MPGWLGSLIRASVKGRGMAKGKGRPPSTAYKSANAEAVALRIMKDRELARMSPSFPDPKQEGKSIKNPASGRKVNKRTRSPRLLSKEVLPEVASHLGVNVETLERHYYENKEGLEQKLVTEIAGEITKRLAERDRIEARTKRNQSNQQFTKVSRNK